MTCRLRACCRGGSGAIMDVDGEHRGVSLLNGDEAPILRTMPEPPPPSRRVAIHEAAHAVVAVALGGTFESIKVSGQPSVAGVAGLEGLARIAMLLAADAAEARMNRVVFTRQPDNLAETFERIDQIKFGNCDECRAALVAKVAGGADRAEMVFREGERLANEVVARPEIWAAINRLADALMNKHEITAAEAAEIIGDLHD